MRKWMLTYIVVVGGRWPEINYNTMRFERKLQTSSVLFFLLVNVHYFNNIIKFQTLILTCSKILRKTLQTNLIDLICNLHVFITLGASASKVTIILMSFAF